MGGLRNQIGEVPMVEGGEVPKVEGAQQEEAQKCAPGAAALHSWSSQLSTLWKC